MRRQPGPNISADETTGGTDPRDGRPVWALLRDRLQFPTVQDLHGERQRHQAGALRPSLVLTVPDSMAGNNDDDDDDDAADDN